MYLSKYINIYIYIYLFIPLVFFIFCFLCQNSFIYIYIYMYIVLPHPPSGLLKLSKISLRSDSDRWEIHFIFDIQRNSAPSNPCETSCSVLRSWLRRAAAGSCGDTYGET